MSRTSVSLHIDTLRKKTVLLINLSGAIMYDNMGTFRIEIEIENRVQL
jgi:hypothetical protein